METAEHDRELAAKGVVEVQITEFLARDIIDAIDGLSQARPVLRALRMELAGRLHTLSQTRHR